jgi:hypothetical protein
MAICASREEVKARVEHAADTLQSLDPLCHKVARYLRNRAAGLSLATGELNTRLHELTTTYSLGTVAVACMLWRLVFESYKMTAAPGNGPNSLDNSSVPLHASSTCWVPNSMPC